jgi:hypothetical protein
VDKNSLPTPYQTDENKQKPKSNPKTKPLCGTAKTNPPTQKKKPTKTLIIEKAAV